MPDGSISPPRLRHRSSSGPGRRRSSARRGARPWRLTGLLPDRLDATVTAVILVVALGLGIAGAATTATARSRGVPTVSGALDPIAMPTPVQVLPEVWIIGDEFAAGSGPKTWTSRTAERLHLDRHLIASAGLGYTHAVKIAGVATSVRSALGRVDPAARAIVLAAGRADRAATPLQLVQAVSQAVRLAASRTDGTPVVVVGPASLAPDAATTLTERKALRSAAVDAGAAFVDPIAGHWLTDADLQPDGVHLTAAGQSAVAAKMEPVLAAALEQ